MSAVALAFHTSLTPSCIMTRSGVWVVTSVDMPAKVLSCWQLGIMNVGWVYCWAVEQLTALCRTPPPQSSVYSPTNSKLV